MCKKDHQYDSVHRTPNNHRHEIFEIVRAAYYNHSIILFPKSMNKIKKDHFSTIVFVILQFFWLKGTICFTMHCQFGKKSCQASSMRTTSKYSVVRPMRKLQEKTTSEIDFSNYIVALYLLNSQQK